MIKNDLNRRTSERLKKYWVKKKTMWNRNFEEARKKIETGEIRTRSEIYELYDNKMVSKNQEEVLHDLLIDRFLESLLEVNNDK